MMQFADSTRPDLIPAEFTHAALYGNGKFQAPPGQVARFKQHIIIGVLPGQPQQAKTCRVLDVERFDADPSDGPQFIQERQNAGHSDATLYCDLANTKDVLSQLASAGMTADPHWRLWLAWYTGGIKPPTVLQVLNELATVFKVHLSPTRLWALQWKPGTEWDTSVLYGTDDFTEATR